MVYFLVRRINEHMRQIDKLKTVTGIWLLEILISVGIMALVASIVALVFNRSLHFYRQATDKNEASQDAQIATEWLVRDLDNATCLSEKTANAVAMENAAGGVRYHLQNAQSPYALMRSLDSVDHVVSDNIDRLNFKYFNAANQQTVTDIKQVEITLAAVSGNQKFSLYTTVPVDLIPGSGWAKLYGGTSLEGQVFITCLLATATGDYILGGEASSFGNMRDFLVIKVNASGEVQWAKTYGGTNDDTLISMQEVAGGYILGGTTRIGLAGSTDFLFIKTDANGNVGPAGTWAKTYGSLSNDNFQGFDQALGGGYVLGGQNGTFLNGDCIVIKIDNTGNWVWGKTYGTSAMFGGNQMNFLEESADGSNILFGGYTNSFGTNGDGLLVKTDFNGDVGAGFPLTWVRTFGGSNDDYLTSILEASSPLGYIVGGFSGSFGAGSYEATLYKIDNNGGFSDSTGTWTKSYGGTDADYLRDFQAISGGYILAGDTWSFGGPGRQDFLLMHVDTDGAVNWAKIYGGDYDDVVNAIDQTAATYVLGGYTQSFVDGLFDAGGVHALVVSTDLAGTLSCCANMDAQDVSPTIGNPRAEPDWVVTDPIANLPGSGWEVISLPFQAGGNPLSWWSLDATTRPGWHVSDKTQDVIDHVTVICSN